ncbi:MAG: PDDEXK nuclease domain-containing protein [Salinivirgaceae bacterium]|nr:PDDEXK nuclease domain-containing protein [Salinivirgaceae bacterium]
MNFDILVHKISVVEQVMLNEVVHAINVSLTVRNWILGYYIVEFEQNGEDRAAYGQNLLKNLEQRLQKKGLTERRFREFRKFYLTYPLLESEIRLYVGTNLNHEIRQIASAELDSLGNQDDMIRRTASAELEQWQTDPHKILYKIPFSHLLILCKIEDPLKRAFYESEIIKGCWSCSELERQVNSLYFERTGLSKDKNRLSEIVNQKSVSLRPKDIVKNPLTLEFLGLQESNVVMENDLENAIINHLQHFLLELGDGFCYEATQKRILIDDEYFKIDLVFYHRILHCHVLVELKTDKFRHEYASQLNLYLNYYKNEIMQSSDNPPIGLLLCTDYGETTVQYATAGLDENLFVSKYLVKLPSVDEIKKYIIEINKR